MNNIIIIDDEQEICESIKMILDYEDYSVEYFTDSSKGMERLEENNFNALLLDIQMPGLNGFEVLEKINNSDLGINVIMISAFSSLENAVKATKMGAFDFLEKPIDRDKLLISVRNAVQNSSLFIENKKLREDLYSESIILGDSKVMKSILDTISRVAVSDARVLINGENGTGKELVAREIHRQSKRSEKPMVEVNCAAIPNELIESELFGHEKGSFTGAINKRIGKFEQANGGTLFLDEIGDMSQQAQAKVLRAIEDGRIERVGSTDKINVDVRILSATNKNLKEEIEKENFREDLYHRLNVIPITIPPLRERVEDIPILVSNFTERICEKNGIPKMNFGERAIKLMQSLKWTGNVRELRNFIERVVILVPKNFVEDKDIYDLLPPKGSKKEEMFDLSNSFQEFKEKAEKQFIERQLKANTWNISKTAEILDIQRSHLYSKMKKYNIEKE